MGCCGSSEGGGGGRRKLSEIDDQPEIANMPSITAVCKNIWEIKDEWVGVRKPLTGPLEEMQTAASWDDGAPS